MQLSKIMTFLLGSVMAFTTLNSVAAEKKPSTVATKMGQKTTAKTAKTTLKPERTETKKQRFNNATNKNKPTVANTKATNATHTKVAKTTVTKTKATKHSTDKKTVNNKKASPKTVAKSAKNSTKPITAKTNKKTVGKTLTKTPKKATATKSLTPKTTKTQYGVKGAKLTHVKISNRTYSYREKGKTHTSINKEKSRQFSQTGVASYYGGMFHGRKTASGEIFNKNAYTAAHKTLALGSYALVTNLRNGRKVIVRINDRGPFSHSRIIDLSVGSAREIGMLHSGIAKVRIEAMQVDSQGYISGKGAESLYKLAKKAGLSLKVKGSGKNFAIKAE